jgi:TPR repeat protein
MGVGAKVLRHKGAIRSVLHLWLLSQQSSVARHSRSATINVMRDATAKMQMEAGASIVDRAEQIRWWNALDLFLIFGGSDIGAVEAGLHITRECFHPDARWLASLFPAGVAVNEHGMCQVLRQHQHDPRAVFLLCFLEDFVGDMRPAAEAGYAPAQAELAAEIASQLSDPDGDVEPGSAEYEAKAAECFLWAQRSASQGDRSGIYQLACCFLKGTGCSKDVVRGIELLKEASELDKSDAQHLYADVAFKDYDWQRFYWWGRAERGNPTPENPHSYVNKVRALLSLFENRALGRILHTVAPVIARNLDIWLNDKGNQGIRLGALEKTQLERVLQLHEAMLGRARVAIDCWSMAGRRCGLVKDMRVKIARMAWSEAWQWGERSRRDTEQIMAATGSYVSRRW